MASVASGAVARAFGTTASEFPGKKIKLRIAPELWLKRLILGGMDRVFEIGSCFRNEGEPEQNADLESINAFAGLDKTVGLTLCDMDNPLSLHR